MCQQSLSNCFCIICFYLIFKIQIINITFSYNTATYTVIVNHFEFFVLVYFDQQDFPTLCSCSLDKCSWWLEILRTEQCLVSNIIVKFFNVWDSILLANSTFVIFKLKTKKISYKNYIHTCIWMYLLVNVHVHR